MIVVESVGDLIDCRLLSVVSWRTRVGWRLHVRIISCVSLPSCLTFSTVSRNVVTTICLWCVNSATNTRSECGGEPAPREISPVLYSVLDSGCVQILESHRIFCDACKCQWRWHCTWFFQVFPYKTMLYIRTHCTMFSPGKSWNINQMVATFLTSVHVFGLYIHYRCPLLDSVRSVV